MEESIVVALVVAILPERGLGLAIPLAGPRGGLPAEATAPACRVQC